MFIVTSLNQARPEARIMGPSLRIGAVAIWVLNSIIFRPGEQEWDEEVIPSSAFYEGNDIPDDTDAEEMDLLIQEGRITPLLQERGCYFVNAIEGDFHGHGFRCPVTRELNAETYAFIYNAKTLPQLEAIFFDSFLKKKRKEAPIQRRTRVKVIVNTTRDSPERNINFGFDSAGIELGPSIMLTGQDIAPHMERGNNTANPSPSTDHEVNLIWRHFLRDLIRVSPSSNEGPYCTLSPEERENITEGLYMSSVLPFRRAIVKAAPVETWDIIFFNRFFPTSAMVNAAEEQRRKQPQHYGSCNWWTSWLSLLRKLPPQADENIRQGLLVEFRKLVWLPWSGSDRI